jgi:hypothetical protein
MEVTSMAHGAEPDEPAVPRCPRCGVYLIIGFVPGRYVAELKRRFGWRIARFDPGVSKRTADAVITGCAAHNCPRCGAKLGRGPA